MVNVCNVHVIYGIKKPLDKGDIEQFLKMLKSGSESNADGFGLFNDKGLIFKKRDRYKAKYSREIIKKFVNSKFIVGHNRWATSGTVNKSNSHPFYNKRFIWVHNGMIQNKDELSTKYGVTYNVDSELIGEILHKKLNKKEELEKTLIEMFKEMQGSFSVFIFDKQTKKLYYVRHIMDFNIFLFRLLDNSLRIIGSTEETNLRFPYHKSLLGFQIINSEILSKFDIEDDLLYVFDDKDGIISIEYVEFKPYKSFTNTGYHFNGRGFSNYGYKSEWMPDIELIEENLQQFFNDKDLCIVPCSKTVYIKCKKTTEEGIRKYFKSFLVDSCPELRIRKTMLKDFLDDLEFTMTQYLDYEDLTNFEGFKDKGVLASS